MLYGLAAFWGFIQVALPNSGATSILFAIAFASVVTSWAVFDSRVHAIFIPSVAWLLYYCTWPAASLLYLIWTRGISGFGYWVVNAIGLVVTVLLLFYLTFYLLYSLNMIDLRNFDRI